MKKTIRALLGALAAVMLFVFPLSACAKDGGGEYVIPVYEDDAVMMIAAWQPYHLENQKRFDDIAEAGFTLVMPLSDVMNFSVNPNGGQTIMSRAAAAGLKVIVIDKGISGEGVWDASKAALYKDEPAFLGVHIYDEPAPGEFEWLGEKRERFKEVFQDGAWFFVNLFPSRITHIVKPNFRTYVRNFIDEVKPNVLSCDSYPLKADGSLMTDFFYDLEMVSYQAKQYEQRIFAESGVKVKIPVNSFILSMPHTTSGYSYRSPSEAELRWQIAVEMAYGVNAVTDYAYQSPQPSSITPGEVYYDALLSQKGEKTPLYDYAKTVNNEVLAWDHVYLKFEWQGTAPIAGGHGRKNPMFTMLPYALDDKEIDGIESVTSTGDALAGVFEDKDGNKGFMVTNATNPIEEEFVDVKVKFDAKYSGVIVYEKGVPRTVDLNENKEAVIELEPGEGKFLIPIVRSKK